jgi:hypothetical protein
MNKKLATACVGLLSVMTAVHLVMNLPSYSLRLTAELGLTYAISLFCLYGFATSNSYKGRYLVVFMAFTVLKAHIMPTYIGNWEFTDTMKLTATHSMRDYFFDHDLAGLMLVTVAMFISIFREDRT